MDPSQRSLSHLETMPDDMLRLIVSKVGATSATDYCNTILTCKNLHFSYDDPLVAKDLNLRPLMKKPLLANRYKKMMDTLLRAKNLDALYIKGVLEYFCCDNRFLGLHHLRLASKGNHHEAKYLYGVLLMALGMIEKGKKILTKLTGQEGLAFVESSWDNIQSSLTNLNCRMKKVYVKSLENLQPEVNCHPPETDTVCSKCFHYYLMSEFFEMVIGLNPSPASAKNA